MSKIIVLRGPYCSGKTTWALKYCSKHKKSIRVCRKDILKTIYCERVSSSAVLITKKVCEQIIYEALKAELDVIIDDEHMLVSSLNTTIKDLSKISKQLEKDGVKIDAKIVVKEFNNTPFIICHRRNKKSPNPKSTKLITKSYLYTHKSDS